MRDQKSLRETSVSGPLQRDDPRRATGAGSGLDADKLDGQDGAYYRSRTNHTDTQAASTISDLTEAVQDVVGALIGDQSGLDWTYNDGANTFTLTVDAAAMRTLLDVWVNLSGDTMTGPLVISKAAADGDFDVADTNAAGAATGGRIRSRLATAPSAANQRLGVLHFGALNGSAVVKNSAAIEVFSTEASGTGEGTEMRVSVTALTDTARTTVATFGATIVTFVVPPAVPAYTVGTLPAAAALAAGAKALVTDATVTTFASAVAGGGGNTVPVYNTGAAWNIG